MERDQWGYPVPINPSHFLKIHLIIILPSVSGYPHWSLSLRFPHQNPVHPLPSPIRATCPAHLILLDITQMNKTYILNALYVLFIWVISRRMRWVGHVARMGEGRVCTGFWWGNLRERDQWGYPDTDGRIIL